MYAYLSIDMIDLTDSVRTELNVKREKKNKGTGRFDRYLDVDHDSRGGARQIARVLHGADYKDVLALSLVVQTTGRFYHSCPLVYGEQFGIPLLDHVRDLLLCIRIIGLEADHLVCF